MKGAPARRQKGVWFRRTARVLTNNWQRHTRPQKRGGGTSPPKQRRVYFVRSFGLNLFVRSFGLNLDLPRWRSKRRMIFWEKNDSHLVALALGFFKKGVFFL
jgi:hypothetical protein